MTNYLPSCAFDEILTNYIQRSAFDEIVAQRCYFLSFVNEGHPAPIDFSDNFWPQNVENFILAIRETPLDFQDFLRLLCDWHQFERALNQLSDSSIGRLMYSINRVAEKDAKTYPQTMHSLQKACSQFDTSTAVRILTGKQTSWPISNIRALEPLFAKVFKLQAETGRTFDVLVSFDTGMSNSLDHTVEDLFFFAKYHILWQILRPIPFGIFTHTCHFDRVFVHLLYLKLAEKDVDLESLERLLAMMQNCIADVSRRSSNFVDGFSQLLSYNKDKEATLRESRKCMKLALDHCQQLNFFLDKGLTGSTKVYKDDRRLAGLQLMGNAEDIVLTTPALSLKAQLQSRSQSLKKDMDEAHFIYQSLSICLVRQYIDYALVFLDMGMPIYLIARLLRQKCSMATCSEQLSTEKKQVTFIDRLVQSRRNVFKQR